MSFPFSLETIMPLNSDDHPIFKLIYQGDLVSLKDMIKEKQKFLFLSARDGKDLLMLALEEGHHEMADWLLSTKAFVLSKQSNDGNTSLLIAVASGKLETVQWLLSHQMLLHQKNKAGYNALQLAIINGYLNIAQLLLQHGAYATEKGSDNGSDTALQLAAANDHIELMQSFQAAGALLTEKGKNGKTPLLCAAAKGKLETVQWLLGHGASLNDRNDSDENVLFCAAANGKLDIILWLVTQGLSLKEKNKWGDNILLCAVANGQLEIVQWLMSQGFSLNEINNNNDTALLLAASNGHLDTVRWLLAHGSSLKEKNKNGRSAFLLAVNNGKLEVAQWLLAQGFSPDETDKRGYTALMYAIVANQLKTVQWLLAHGASLSVQNARGEDALMIAVNGRNSEIIRYLLDKNVIVNEKIFEQTYTKKALLDALQRATSITYLSPVSMKYFDFNEQKLLSQSFSRNQKIIDSKNRALSFINQYANNPEQNESMLSKIQEQIAYIQGQSVDAVQLLDIYQKFIEVYALNGMLQEALEFFQQVPLDAFTPNERFTIAINFLGVANNKNEPNREEFLDKAITLFELGNSKEDKQMLLRCSILFVMRPGKDAPQINISSILENDNKDKLAHLARRHPQAFSLLIEILIEEKGFNTEWINFLQELGESQHAERLCQTLRNQKAADQSEQATTLQIDDGHRNWNPEFFEEYRKNKIEAMDVSSTTTINVKPF